MRPELLAAPFSFGIESVDGIGVVLDKVEEDIQMSSHDVFLLASESETFAPWLSLGPDESETFVCEGTGLRDVKELALSGKVVDDSNHGDGFAVRAEEQWPCMLFHKRRGVPEWPSQLWRPVTGASEHDSDKRNDGLSTPGHSIPGASGQNTGGSNDLPTAMFSAETPTSSASADCMRVELTTVVPTPTFINAPVTAVATTQKVNRKKAKQSAVMKKSPLKMKQRQQAARGPITKDHSSWFSLTAGSLQYAGAAESDQNTAAANGDVLHPRSPETSVLSNGNVRAEYSAGESPTKPSRLNGPRRLSLAQIIGSAHLSINKAADKFSMSPTYFKTLKRPYAILSWPSRQIVAKSIKRGLEPADFAALYPAEVASMMFSAEGT